MSKQTSLQNDLSSPRVIPGRWIVRYRPLLQDQVRRKHLSLVNARTNNPSDSFNCYVHGRFELGECNGYSATFDDNTKAQLEKLPEVYQIEPVQLYNHCQVQQNAPWGLNRITSQSALQTGSSDTSTNYKYGYDDAASGSGTIAYVLDSGINFRHRDFEGRARRGPKFVTVYKENDPNTVDPNVVTSDEDVEGHGTHVAGTIAGKTWGVAKNATVVGVKIFNDLPNSDRRAGATTEDIIQGLKWVIEEQSKIGNQKVPAVVNCSFSGRGSEIMDTAIADTVRAGIVVCVAAGNAARDATSSSPARVPLAITVGATDIDDNIAFFSNYGKIVDIMAPGHRIKSTWIGSDTATNSISGTSMACPHVVGVACCFLSDSRWVDRAPALVMSEILVRADKNGLKGLEGKRDRTIDAVLQLHDPDRPIQAML